MRLDNLLTRHLKKYKLNYLIGILAVLFVDYIQLWIPQITGVITDGLQQKTMSFQGIIPQIIRLLIIGIAITGGRFVWRLFIFGTSRYVERDMRNEFFSKILRLSQEFFNVNKTGDMMAHATNDMGAVRMMAGPGILMLLDTVVFTTLVIYKMVTYIDIKLTLIAIIPMPFIALNSLFTGKAIRKRFKDKQDAFSEMTEVVQENISGIRVIKAFVQEKEAMKAFNRLNQKNYEKNMRVIFLQSLMQPIAAIVVGASIVLVLANGGYMAMIGTITIGDLVAFIQYLFMLIWPMIALGWGVNIYSQGIASLDRIEKIMAEKETVFDECCDYSIQTLNGDIEIKDLYFEYTEGRRILNNVTGKITKGQTIGIVGRTGSGKTTFVNLLARLFNSPKNTIYIGGYELFQIPLKTLRQHVVYVPQDNFLFSESIKNNIAFANHDKSDDEIVDAAKAAAVHDNIIDFKEGYETVVGEKGVTLSGGQKQRVSMARAFITDAPILILDDSVSAVDTNTEDLILRQLNQDRADKTTIIIAHRLSTLQHADQIWVFDKGSIIEKGTHQELLDLKGHYYELSLKQQLEKEIEAMD